MADSRLPANRLELEITESLLLQDAPTTRSALAHLRSTGVRISLDDFGTGYSSLNYLRAFPLDKVKIDQTFIRRLQDDEKSLILLKGMARLSSELGLTVAVEGIETEQQSAIASAETYIDEVQGFLFSPPVPSLHIRDLLHSFSPTAARSHTKGSTATLSLSARN